MEKFKAITYKYNSRTKRYYIGIKNADKIKEVFGEIIGKQPANLLFIKTTPVSFEFWDFFLLELLYVLETVKEERPDLGMKIGGLELNTLIEFLKTKTWISERYLDDKTIKLNLNDITKHMKYKPLPHQLTAYKKYEEVKKLANLRGNMLDAAVGAGKTYLSLSLAEILDYETVIIIAPSSTIDSVWINSINDSKDSLYKQPQPYIRLTNKDKDIKNKRFIILHYEFLEKLHGDKKLLRQLKRLKPMLIVDEFHNFNEITSKRTNYLLDIVNYIDFEDIALLTGTPIKMHAKELAPMLYILDRKFPPVKDLFFNFYQKFNESKINLLRYRFGLYKERIEKDRNMLPDIKIQELKITIPNGEEFTVENINNRIKEYKTERLLEIEKNKDMYKAEFEKLLTHAYMGMLDAGFKKGDASNIIKEYKRLVKVISKHAKKRELYKIQDIIKKASEMEKNQIQPYLNPLDTKEFKNIKSIIKYPELKVLGEALGKILLGSRIKCYMELAKNINYRNIFNLTNKKSIIFSNYVSVCTTAKNKVIKEGYNPILVYSEHTEHLSENVKKFNDLSNNLNPLIATFKSLSTGVPLTAANIVIFIDIPLRLYLFTQAVARAHRIGQDKEVTVLLAKLDTGKKFNITERDLYIVNMSQYNVEMITGYNSEYDIPKQEILLDQDIDDDIDEDVLEELEETVEEEIKKELNNFIRNIDIEPDYDNNIFSKIILKKFNWKLK